jgi:hypothetical protein
MASFTKQYISSRNVKILESAPMGDDELMHPYYWQLTKREFDIVMYQNPEIPPDEQNRMRDLMHQGKIIESLDAMVLYVGQDIMIELLRKIKPIMLSQHNKGAK